MTSMRRGGREQGVVESFNSKMTNFGFIIRASGRQLYLHATDVEHGYKNNICAGDTVEYSVVAYKGGLKAAEDVNVARLRLGFGPSKG